MDSRYVRGLIVSGLVGIGIGVASLTWSYALDSSEENTGESPVVREVSTRVPEEKNTIPEDVSRTLEDIVTPAIPVEEPRFIAQLPSLEGDGYIRHPVERGESYISIAKQHTGMDEGAELYGFVDDIIAENGGEQWPRYGDIVKIPIESGDASDQIPYSDMNTTQREEFLRERSSPGSHGYISEILEISDEKDIDARIPMAIASAESGFDNGAVSSMGAQSMWQLMPEYHGSHDDPMNALSAALDFFKGTYEHFSERLEDEDAALISTIAAYNVGPGRVKQWLDSGVWDGRTLDEIPRNGNDSIGYSSETRDYVRRVVLDTLQETYNVNLDL
ncbi:MAG: transglycosylase SLT domain-containing protein [Candidatus Woesearchaeota archaeon]